MRLYAARLDASVVLHFLGQGSRASAPQNGNFANGACRKAYHSILI